MTLPCEAITVASLALPTCLCRSSPFTHRGHSLPWVPDGSFILHIATRHLLGCVFDQASLLTERGLWAVARHCPQSVSMNTPGIGCPPLQSFTLPSQCHPPSSPYTQRHTTCCPAPALCLFSSVLQLSTLHKCFRPCQPALSVKVSRSFLNAITANGG